MNGTDRTSSQSQPWPEAHDGVMVGVSPLAWWESRGTRAVSWGVVMGHRG